ncbi:PH domain-containing protein [Spirillospora sp. CA-255316]
MAADPFRREYRADLGTFAMAFVLGFHVLVVTIIVWRGENNSAAVKVLVPGLLVGFIALYVGANMWARTYVSRDRILKRGLFQTVATPWQAIQGIEIERRGKNPYVVIYDYQGRRIALPHLRSSEADIDEEVRALREIWEKRRGPHWKPIPEVAARISLRE